jgi:hypothetical protein
MFHLLWVMVEEVRLWGVCFEVELSMQVSECVLDVVF